MKFLFSFIIFTNIFNIFFLLEKENISTFNYDLKKIKLSNNINNFASGSDDCNDKYLYPFLGDLSKVNYTELVKCVINCSIYEISNLKTEINYLKTAFIFIDIDEMEEGNIKLMLTIIRDSIKNGIIDELYELIENNTSILNYLLDILIETEKGENANADIIYDLLYKIFNINGVYDFLLKFYNQSKKDFLDILGIIANNYDELKKLYNILINNFQGYEVDFLKLAFDILKNYEDRNAIINIIKIFFKTHKTIFPKLKEVIIKPEMNYLFRSLLTPSDEYLLAIKELIFSKNDTETINLFFSIAENDDLFDLLVNILINIKDETFLSNSVGPFFSGIVALNSSNIDFITNLIFELGVMINQNSPLTKITLTQAQEYIANLLKKNNYEKYNISSNCLELIECTYFDYQAQTKQLFLQYFQKFLFDSSRSKGNLLTFDNCLGKENLTDTPDKYYINPAFVIGIVNYPEQKEKTKDSSFYSKSDYIGSICFPYGFKNKDDEEKDQNPMCSKKDYAQIFKFTNSFIYNFEEPNVETILLYQNNIIPGILEDIYGILALILLSSPLIINLILVICKKVIISKQKTNININELITDDEKRKKNKIAKKELLNVDKNKNERKKRVIFPNWYLFLKECFDIIKNWKELFNFSLNDTGYNNFNGMTYIKGLIGISIILTIYGYSFIASANFPLKVYGLWGFYQIMKNFFYPLLFFGYKYSPRILFSCSGYTLIYKFLCYIEQEETFCLPKFIFLQSYKYILLILVLVYFKYMIYYVIILFTQQKRPVWEIFNYYLDIEKDFFRNFFSFLSDISDNGNGIKQHLIAYFYISINEVLFFIFGTIIIFCGYKYKLRIDLIILIIILIIYCARIILFLTYILPVEHHLTTIGYLLFDYGLFIVQPLYNISSFLIGMYFGLINYSIQKGITELEKKSNYNSIILQMSEAEFLGDDGGKKNVVKRNSNFKSELEARLRKLTINDSSSDEEKSINNVPISKSQNTKGKENLLKNLREDDVKDINKKNNEKLEKFIGEEKNSRKIEYSEKIKQMPFLISPIKFYNFHRKNKSKCFLNIFILIAILILSIIIIKEIILTEIYIKPDEIPEGSKIVNKLSFTNLFQNPALNIFNLIDIEIVVFIVQWITFILYFKEFEIIRSFINHIYWSFFVKSYFSFTLVSIPTILFFLYDETVIKLGIYTNLLYTLINTISIIIVMIITYTFYELPLKKAFKFLLKGKEMLNNEEDEDDDEEEEEEDKNDEDEDEECPKEDDDE